MYIRSRNLPRYVTRWSPCLAGRGKTTSVQAYFRSSGLQVVEAPIFLDNRHMKVVRLSTLRTGRLYTKEMFLVLISIRGWVDPRAIVRPDRLRQWKFPMALSGIEPGTFRLAAQCLAGSRRKIWSQHSTSRWQHSEKWILAINKWHKTNAVE